MQDRPIQVAPQEVVRRRPRSQLSGVSSSYRWSIHISICVCIKITFLFPPGHQFMLRAVSTIALADLAIGQSLFTLKIYKISLLVFCEVCSTSNVMLMLAVTCVRHDRFGRQENAVLSQITGASRPTPS